MSSMNDQVLRRLYDAHASLVVELFQPFEQGLTRLGLGNDRSYEFRRDTDAAVARILFPDDNDVAGVRFSGPQASNQRRARLTEFFLGLGVSEQLSTYYAETLDSHAATHHNPDGSLKPGHQPWNVNMLMWWTMLFNCGRRTYERLARIRRDASEPYEDAEETFELLARFPGLADAAYTIANIPGIEGFPPQPIGGAPTGDGAVILTEYEAHSRAEAREEILWAAGLAIVAIAATVLSAGTLGPLAAAAIGTGLGAAQGGYMIYDRAAAVAEGRLAVAHGAMDEAELQRLENALTGAWRGLIVDMATGGLLGRFGGTRLLSSVVRGTVISGTGGGLATAVDPNVWSSPNRVALIMDGFVIGAITGGVGSAAGTGLSNLLRRGSQVQVAVDRSQGPLGPGKEVHVSPGPDAPPLRGTITEVDPQANTVTVAVGDETITVRPQRTIEVENSDGPGTPPADDGPPAAATSPGARPGGVPHAIVEGQSIPPHHYQGGYYGNAVNGGDSAQDIIERTFREGMPARGGNMDLRRHSEEMDVGAADFDQRSAFRGTTQNVSSPDGESGAAVWAGEGGVVFQIEGVPTWEVNLALQGRVQRPDGSYRGNLMHGEHEHAVLSQVPANRISRAGIVTVTSRGIPIVRTWIDNPAFVPRSR